MPPDNSSTYSENLSLDGLTTHQFLVIALDTAKDLNWLTTDISKSELVSSTRNGLYSWNAEIKVKIEPEQAVIRSSTANDNVHAIGDKNKETVQKFIEKFNALKGSYTTEQLEQKYEELKIDFTDSEEVVPDKPRRSFEERVNSFISLFKPKPGYFITPIIVYLNVGIWILMVATGVSFILPGNEDLIKWGANFRPLTLNGQWWRLITCCFLHIGIIHLLFNMYALVYVGALLEPHLGRTRFAAAYLLTGIASGTASLYWHDRTISAGASGAIFGLYGVFLAMLTTNLINKDERMKLLKSIGIFIFYNLAYGMKDGIDNAAHIGGLASGLVIGYAIYPSLKKPRKVNLEYGTVVLITVLIMASSFIVYKYVPKTDNTIYIDKMMQFSDLEKRAMKIYHLPANTDRETMLAAVDSGIYYWNSCINLVNGMDTLKLSDEIHNRNKKIVEYCHLRIESYEQMKRNADDNFATTSIIHNASMNYYNLQIKAILDSLKQK